jgi:hypothetical protein
MAGRRTYANVVSTLALILAMSGTAYAVATVTSGDIVNHTIKLKDISDLGAFGLLPETQSGHKDDGGTIMGSSQVTVATLDIAGDGNFIVLAKMWVVNEVGATTMFCRLNGGQTFDINHFFLAQAGQPGSTESMSFMIGEFFDAGESATIVCNPLGGQIHVFDIKMTAIEAGGGAEEPL